MQRRRYETPRRKPIPNRRRGRWRQACRSRPITKPRMRPCRHSSPNTARPSLTTLPSCKGCASNRTPCSSGYSVPGRSTIRISLPICSATRSSRGRTSTTRGLRRCARRRACPCQVRRSRPARGPLPPRRDKAQLRRTPSAGRDTTKKRDGRKESCSMPVAPERPHGEAASRSTGRLLAAAGCSATRRCRCLSAVPWAHRHHVKLRDRSTLPDGTVQAGRLHRRHAIPTLAQVTELLAWLPASRRAGP